MTHILEDLTYKMESQPPKKQITWVLGIDIYCIYYMYWLGPVRSPTIDCDLTIP